MSTPQESYREYLETLSPSTLEHLPNYVFSEVHFSDPFNNCVGVERLRAVFSHMFENVQDVKFHVSHEATSGDVALWNWRLTGVLRGKAWNVEGASTIHFNNDGLVTSHVDYWDAATNFYEKLPVIGPVLRRIRYRLAQH